MRNLSPHIIPFAMVEQRLQSAGLLSGIEGPRPESVSGVTDDSRLVGPGNLFVAVTGAVSDGHMFIDRAVDRGACVVVAERRVATAVTNVMVTDARRALCELASLAFGDPGQVMQMAATTGTNGKTTTATLMADALDRLGIRSGFIGTTGYRIGAERKPATHTTPSAVSLHALLAKMLDRDLTACALEASSHALDQHRLRPADIDVAVFTNLTRDHLDYHGSEAAYLKAKKSLFDGLQTGAVAVVNADDPAAEAMVADCAARVVRVGEGAGVDVRWTLHGLSASGLELTIDGQRVQTQLSGRFNAINVALTHTALVALGHAPDRVSKVVSDLLPVRGRFEVLPLPDERTAIVDYAHTPDALAKVLETARELVAPNGHLWVVFGCGGDRDRGKRPLMGRVAVDSADRVVLTSDNPRSEDPASIIDEIRTGLPSGSVEYADVDRSAAIDHALRGAGPGDVVVIAGKGHETHQVIGSDVRPFDDRAVVLHSMES